MKTRIIAAILLLTLIPGVTIAATVPYEIDPWVDTVSGNTVDSETTVEISVNGGVYTTLEVLPAGTLIFSVTATPGDVLQVRCSTTYLGETYDCVNDPYTVPGLSGGCATVGN